MVGDRRRDRRHLGQRLKTPNDIPIDVRRRQNDAANPGVSAWVAANAGSGKTYVLAQRVINLLLRGAEPEKILCITFTKAAAANMSKQVFDRLAEWTMLDDAEQSQLLERLTLDVLLAGAAAPDSALARALTSAMTAGADQTFRDVV